MENDLPRDEWNAYRLGDVYWHEWTRLEKTTLKNFPDTIAADYIAQKTKRHDIDTLSEICASRCGLCKQQNVVHLRVGDSMCRKGKQESSRHPEDPSILLENINKHVSTTQENPTHLTLISGSHIDACAEETNKYISDCVHTLQDGGYLVTKQTMHPDDDFCDMVGSSLFIQGKGGFSELASNVRNNIGMDPSKTLQINDLTNYIHMGRGWTGDS